MAGTGFDQSEVYFTDPFGSEDTGADPNANVAEVKKQFRDFIREFHETNFVFPYRDQLKRNYNLGQYCLDVSLDDLRSYDEHLAEKILKSPTEYVPVFEEAAREMADEVTKPRPIGEEDVEDIQVTFRSEANSMGLRDLKSEHVSKLVKIPGIIVSASAIRVKATRITIQCRGCKNTIPNIGLKPGLEGYAMPRSCPSDQTSKPAPCPLDPFFILPDKCRCVDYQVLKLQESPDAVPNGEMPRHLQLYCDRYLTEQVVPGNRVTITGIFSIKKTGPTKKRGNDEAGVGIRKPYIRVVGIHIETAGPGRSSGSINFTAEDEEDFRKLASQADVFDVISRSIAPSIYGSEDVKKAIACLLFGGSRKRLPDGLTRRGDINVLLLGDPGTAKSQLLKFVEKVSPIGVYTSGKGSSAAGLTASVTRDPVSRNFIMEGGAMVLADGGVVCIDEFDKMRQDDRVAIHEAMEQQTISIAKAGITTTLNSRCSVLAAANSVFGRWDDTKGEENIDFMPTILSRFDTIFIIKDEHDQQKDMRLAKHVMQVHLNAAQANEGVEGDLSLMFLKKYIDYCRRKCGPRLSEGAAEKLKNQYVLMRSGARHQEQETSKRSSIPITVRQLEAIVRISESLAKMRLQPFATETDVDEALRLFQVSTLDAAMSGGLSGAEGFTPEEELAEVRRVEAALKKRFAIGSQVSEQRIISDFVRQKYSEKAISTVIHIMLRRGEIEHKYQRKVLYRVR
ncbi:DNA replication licensing factor mcm5-like [Hydractinia symbiolongicarpus]|uniref:DNA replication licensing factor mcm5-like n=1 Tax=Hydractinia symbiolongicarpus TaxID=13093 RepID=UPI00254EB95D|nr:DNA replication licensing factor mcm5-like [Hydractinia symbiolongicarpus]